MNFCLIFISNLADGTLVKLYLADGTLVKLYLADGTLVKLYLADGTLVKLYLKFYFILFISINHELQQGMIMKTQEPNQLFLWIGHATLQIKSVQCL